MAASASDQSAPRSKDLRGAWLSFAQGFGSSIYYFLLHSPPPSPEKEGKKKKGKSVNTPPTIVGHHSRIANHPRRCGLSQNYCHGERERESANVSSTELSILIRIISLALKGSHFGAHCTAGNENRENSGIEEKNIT